MNKDLSGNAQNFLNTLDLHLQNIPAACPYGLPHQAIYRMARFSAIPENIMGILLAAGFRRYGDTLYTMGCEKCQSCVPIKLDPFEFFPNRNQKRSAKRNKDITIKKKPLMLDKEKIALLKKFFNKRFPDNNNRASEYYAGFFLNSSEHSMEISYYEGINLIGVSIVDIGKNWLSAVYFFFDPESSKRSLGTFNIINLVNICKEHNIHNMYLGFWLKEIKAMNYKASFLPHYIFVDESWNKVT